MATAAGLCFASLGTDTGGSIRYPSSADGLIGLKPTYGRISRFGVLTFSASLDHVGSMTRSVADAAIMFDAIAGHDSNDSTSLMLPPPNTLAQLGQGIRGMRIGIDRHYSFEGVDEGNTKAIETALKVMEGLGARVVDVRMPDLQSMLRIWQIISSAEIVQAHAKNYPSHAAEYGPYMHEFLDTGARVTSEQLAQARKDRAALSARFTRVLDSVDAMACSAGGSPAWSISRQTQVGPLGAFHAAWSAAQP